MRARCHSWPEKENNHKVPLSGYQPVDFITTIKKKSSKTRFKPSAREFKSILDPIYLLFTIFLILFAISATRVLNILLKKKKKCYQILQRCLYSFLFLFFPTFIQVKYLRFYSSLAFKTLQLQSKHIKPHLLFS